MTATENVLELAEAASEALTVSGQNDDAALRVGLEQIPCRSARIGILQLDVSCDEKRSD